MTDLTEWSSNANEVLDIRLKHTKPDETTQDVHFQPAFTYPIFGDEETIFGYKGLKIQLNFRADTLEPELNVAWDQKYQPVGEEKADEVEEILRACLPGPTETTPPTAPGTAWEPPGELLHQYDADGKAFGIWSTNLKDPRAKALLRNMQILVLFFIEGGSLLELNDPDWTMERWTIFLIYAIEPVPSRPETSTYTLAGYSTAYRLFFLDTTSPLYNTPPGDSATSSLPLTTDTTLSSRLPCRQRISQFLILPVYQNSGHGSTLYNTMLTHFLTLPSVTEITVEDPNESFDDLRDINDLLRLRAAHTTFTTLSLNTNTRLPPNRSLPFDPTALLAPEPLEALRLTAKLAPRQFARLVEMQLLTNIPPRHRHVARITRKDKASDEHDRAYYFWRLYVKLRLYRHNLDQLAQLELEERVEKLDETCGGVERDYERLLELAERRGERGVGWGGVGDGKAAAADGGAALVSRGKKRRVVDDDEDEDGEGGEADDAGSAVRNGNGTTTSTVTPVAASATNGKGGGSGSVKKKVKLQRPEVVDLASD